MKIVMGIDPGLAFTGFGIIKVAGNKYTHIDHGIIKTDTRMDSAQRLLVIYQSLAVEIEKHQPVEAGIEKIFFGQNAKTAFAVSEAKGVIKMCLAQRGVLCFEYTPLEIKQSVLGWGKAEKQQIKEMVRIIFNLKEAPQYDHSADALAAAVCHCHFSNIRELVSRKNKDV